LMSFILGVVNTPHSRKRGEGSVAT
jgi:hypothetical protein